MNLITIDFETYYSKEYGLKKYTTEAYIRDPQFEVIGVAVKENNKDTVWFSGSHEEIKSFLHSYDFENSFALGHNMRFDGAILSWIFDIKPKGLLDTMGMGTLLHGLTESVSLNNLSGLYGLGVKGTEVQDALGKHRNQFSVNELHNYGLYCKNDVNLTHALFYQLIPKYNKTELKLIDLTIRMFTEPAIQLNKGLLVRHLADVKATKEELLDKVAVCKDENFIHIANRGLLAVPLKYSGAVVSHRWSGVDGINLQNLPRSSELRRAMCAPKGYKLVAADLSNIELRLAYWFAQSTDKVNLIREGVDLYKQSASDITGIAYDEVDKDLRFIFKVVNLSGIYGVGAVKMHSILTQGGVDKDINEVKT